MDGEGKNVAKGDQSMGENTIHDHDPNKKGDSCEHNILPVSMADDLQISTGWFSWSDCVAPAGLAFL